jgi:hypothetical protein
LIAWSVIPWLDLASQWVKLRRLEGNWWTGFLS